MPQQRPTSVLVIAIFHFLLGGLGLICNLCGMANQVAGSASKTMFTPPGDAKQAQLQRDMEKAMEKADPHNKLMQIIDSAVSLCFACVLLAAGYGLLNMAPWGRSLSIVYGIVALIEKLAIGLYAIMVTLPAMGTMMKPMLSQVQTPQERQIMEVAITMGKVFAFVGVIIPLIYPFVVLMVMNSATVKNAFRNAGNLEADDGRERSLDEGFPSNQPYRSGPDDRFKA